MRYRKLRIAWSVFWGLACVLLIVLWVRSYTIMDWCYGLPHAGNTFHLQSAHGRAILFERQETAKWEMGSVPLKNCGQELRLPYTGSYSASMISIKALGGNRIATVPLWPLLIGVVLAATAPWLRWRFSLRTLLIATTLVAVVLGLIMVAMRWPAG